MNDVIATDSTGKFTSNYWFLQDTWKSGWCWRRHKR